MIEDNLEIRGWWWLPGQEAGKGPGTLTFQRGTGARLALIGSLRGFLDHGEREEQTGVTSVTVTADTLSRSGVYPRLHGTDGTKAYTLEDCFQLQLRNGWVAGQGFETIRVGRIVRGAYYQKGEALEATSISVELAHLTDWIGETGLSEEWNWPERGELPHGVPRFRLEAKDLPKRSILLEGAELSLVHGLGISGSLSESRALIQGFTWRIDVPSKLPMNDLLDLASDLQDLVSAGVGLTAAFNAVSFEHPDLVRDLPDGRQRSEEIDLFAQWNALDNSGGKRGNQNDMLFTFKQLGELEGVQRWMVVAAKYRDQLGRVMGARYSSGTFVADRLLNCCAALESFDRERTGEQNRDFTVRLKRSASLAGDLFTSLVGDVEAWAIAAKDERNEVAHHFGRATRTPATGTVYLWESLYWLFVTCMLRESAAPDEVFAQMTTTPRYDWLRRGLSRVLAS